MSRPAKMLIDLKALTHNIAIAHKQSPNSRVIAVLKANAYGHGAIEVANAIDPSVDMFAVSSIEEALHLRNAGIEKTVLLLEGCFSGSELDVASNNDFAVVFHNLEQVEALEQQALGQPISCWLKIDTGMHRLGLQGDDITAAFERLQASANSKNDLVLMTHLASSDLIAQPFTTQQMSSFAQAIAQLGERANGLQTSICNSGAVLGWQDIQCDWIRPGIMIYGVSPFAHEHKIAKDLKPVMCLQSEVIAVRTVPAGDCVGYGNTWQAQRDSKVATVAIGYGDGYPRNAKNGTPVLVNGKRCKLAGRVSMDMLSVDVTEIDSVNIGDKVVLWGCGLDVNEVASYADTIGYELVTRMPLRVPKTYLSK